MSEKRHKYIVGSAVMYNREPARVTLLTWDPDNPTYSLWTRHAEERDVAEDELSPCSGGWLELLEKWEEQAANPAPENKPKPLVEDPYNGFEVGDPAVYENPATGEVFFGFVTRMFMAGEVGMLDLYNTEEYKTVPAQLCRFPQEHEQGWFDERQPAAQGAVAKTTEPSKGPAAPEGDKFAWLR